VADLNIGDITAKIRIDTSGLTQGMRQAEQQLAHFGQAFSGSVAPAALQQTREGS
jgi:hypothetical protein